ncbi:glycoside hydrolase [Ascodesmis nigricans]|uniref:Glycoside hydrolase n=1 Tax=Ascodesmis nigricans TaxID=341454 RepID=A0A4S2MWV2_9PEZI|nr:glycoside hydrolase [Ascodesmis nigricans]
MSNSAVDAEMADDGATTTANMTDTNSAPAHPDRLSPAPPPPNLDSELLRWIGQMIMVTFDGTSVTPDIRKLIEKYHVGGILLTPNNIRDSTQLSTLIHDLQKIAHAAEFKHPLMIAIEQENGMVRRLGGTTGGTLFPGAMGIGATRSPNQAFEVAKATGAELAAIGVNWNIAPVLNLASDHQSNPISVRAFGDDPLVVGKFGEAFVDGLHAGGVANCAKYFHGAISTEDGLRNSVYETAPREELETTELGPFRRAVVAGLDGVMLGSSIWTDPDSMVEDESPSARAQLIINSILRRQFGFNGVVLCDATHSPVYLNDTNKLGEAVVVAIEAGCDMTLISHDSESQQMSIESVYDAVRSGRINRGTIHDSVTTRIVPMKDRFFNWRTTLVVPDPQNLEHLVSDHEKIAQKAFQNLVTVVRDDHLIIPLSNKILRRGEVLLLTPVVRPLDRRLPEEPTMDPFECFGRSLAQLHPRIVHAPYRAQGLTETHVELFKRCSAVILVTVNARRTPQQVEIAHAVLRLSNGKPLVAVAACDPHDLLDNINFGTYLCTYEYSQPALESAAAIIFGERHASGVLPVHIPGTPVFRQQHAWYVEPWDKRRDLYPSAEVWAECMDRRWPLDVQTLSSLLDRPGTSQHFVVRHPENGQLLGLAATYVVPQGADKIIGSLALLLVKPTHRDRGIGLSLHECAIRHLKSLPGITSIQLGSIFPRIFPGLPTTLPPEDQSWFLHRGWKCKPDEYIFDLFMYIESFIQPESIHAELDAKNITIANCRPDQFPELMKFELEHFSAFPGWTERYANLEATKDIADALIAFNQEKEILGAVLVYSPMGNNQIARDIPWPKMIDDRVGGLGFVSVKPEFGLREDEVSGVLVRRGLIVAAILELKMRGLRGCFIDWADDVQTYMSLGFQEWGKYREFWRKI